MMEKTKTKQQLSKELNTFLRLDVKWDALQRTDLEKVRRFFFQELTLVKAANLSMSVFRQRLTQIPAVLAVQERMQVIRKQEAQVQQSKPQTVRAPGHLDHQQPGTPAVLQVQKDFNLPTQPEKQKRIQYIS